MINKNLYKFVFLIFTLFAFSNVKAADISAVASKISVTENQTFTVSIYTNTKGQTINNIEGLISFPSDLLSIDSVSSTGSVFSMWVEQPTFSNINGTVSFNGGVPTPGYNGSNGKVIGISFRAKKSGVANIKFSDVSIYANDGLGTNITSGKYGTTVTINPYKGVEKSDEIMTSDKLPPSPVITSSEMPDPEAWYSLNKATFTWNLPEGVTSVQVLLNDSPSSVPTVTYNTPINKKEINDFNDGTHYIHVRFKNSVGWGKTTHRKIKIDTTSPKNLLVEHSVTNDDLLFLKLSAVDATSGVSKYKILIDGIALTEVIAKNGVTESILPAVNSGNHEVDIIVYDRALNLNEKIFTLEFPKIKSPEITKYSESIKKGENIEISGKSYPNTDVRIWLQLEGEDTKNYIVKTIDNGNFDFTTDYINTTGLASFWAETLRSESVVSSPSDKYFVVVNKTPFVKMSLLTIEVLSLTIPILLLIILLIYLTLHAYHRLSRIRRRLMIDLEQTESEAHKIFKILKEDAKHTLKIFEKNNIKSKISEEDGEVIDTLSKDIEEAEEYFRNRIKDIEKKDL